MINYLNKEIKRAKRYNRKLSLIFCDIDHFKEINDTYGHQMGDFVLKGVANTLHSSIRREIDVVSRYGGEEFLIILPEIGPEDAYSIAERIRINIAEKHFNKKNLNINLTASFGVMGVKNFEEIHDITVNKMIKIVDKKLYESKSLGRNRVSI
jgi:two-component system cell cycle response regulator